MKMKKWLRRITAVAWLFIFGAVTFLLTPESIRSSITYPQNCQHNQSSSQTVACTLSSSVAANDFIIAEVFSSCFSADCSTRVPAVDYSIADTIGNTWTSRPPVFGTNSSGFASKTFYVCATASGSSDTVTVTEAHDAELFIYISVQEIAGLNTGTCADVTATGKAARTPNTTPAVATSNTATTTNATDLLIGTFAKGGATTYTPGGDGTGGTYTVRVFNDSTAIETECVGSTNTYSATINFDVGGAIAYTSDFLAIKGTCPSAHPANSFPRVAELISLRGLLVAQGIMRRDSAAEFEIETAR